MGEVREYVHIKYRKQDNLNYKPYELPPRRQRLMHMSKLYEFQMRLRQGGHQILSISRITKDEYEQRKMALLQLREAKLQAAAGKEKPNEHLAGSE